MSDRHPSHISRSVLGGVITGWLGLFIRVGSGFVTFRILYQWMSADPEQFGLWSIMWSMFGYGILLDLGFGLTAQKSVVELSAKQDWERLSRILSTTIIFYLVAAVVVCGAGTLFSTSIVRLLKITAERQADLAGALTVFIFGIGLTLPLGVAPEVLRGQQRQMLANLFSITGSLANLISVVVVVKYDLSFLTLIVLCLLCVLIPNLAAAVVALRRMPNVVLSPRNFSVGTMREIGRFSVFAYINSLGNMIRTKFDQPVIGVILGARYVAFYQAAGKTAEMYGVFVRQIADALSPVAAHLHVSNDPSRLRSVMRAGMRFTAGVATPLAIIFAAYMEPLLSLVTGTQDPTPPMICVGWTLIAWNYSASVTSGVYRTMFMMAGHERRIVLTNTFEALLNVVLSVGLTVWIRHRFGSEWAILGVALGSAVSAAIYGWGIILHWTAREIDCSVRSLLTEVVLKPWLGCLPVVLWIVIERSAIPGVGQDPTLLTFLEMILLIIAGLAGSWLIVLDPAERRRVLERFGLVKKSTGTGLPV